MVAVAACMAAVAAEGSRHRVDAAAIKRSGPAFLCDHGYVHSTIQ